MMTYIRNLIKRAFISSKIDDSKEFQVAQISYLGTTTNAEIFHAYGFGSNPPVNSYAVAFCVQGQEENQVCFVYDPVKRIKNLKPGETYIANPETGTNLLNKQNGDMSITVKNDMNVDISKDCISVISGEKKLTISKDFNISVSGNVKLTCSGSTTIDCNDINLGTSGKGIARLDDTVEVIITSGSSAGTWQGKITSASTNNKSK